MTIHSKTLYALFALCSLVAIAQNRSWSADPKLVEQLSKRADANYDEAKVPPYQLPDPLKTRDGASVTSSAMWTSQRRPELLDLFRDEVYGRRPKTRYSVSFRQQGEVSNALDGAATGRSMIA